ncbi:MAG: YitT family protein [Tyzzerella sp.]|nr:YitT family protein [Tyzzerella sp.]
MVVKNKNIKTYLIDLLADIIGSLSISVGVYNFAAASGFPVTGVSGISLVFYYYWHLPIGLMTMALNIPIILICGRILGIKFMLRSFKTMLISLFFMDVVAPLLPVYQGELILSCICMGIFSGVGYALIYMRGSSTGGSDFITMAIRAKRPHLSLGRIIVTLDFFILLFCGLLMGGNVDKIIYGLIAAYIVSVVVDKVMYGLDAGKVSLIVTEHGKEISGKIYELTGRGATLLRGSGSYSQDDKQVVLCACSYKQMHVMQRAVKEVDKNAFMVIMEANQVRGHGFKPH